MSTSHHIKPGNTMLRWVSEQETGSWTQFRQVAATCLTASDEVSKASTLAMHMSDLGHLDIEWEAGRWSVAPPVVAVSPGMGMCTYLAGWRTSWLESRFDQATDDLDIFPLVYPQQGAPAAMFAKCGSIVAIKQFAEQLHLPIVWDPSAQLAELVSLPDIQNMALAAEPYGEDDVEMFDPATGAFNRATSRAITGLYTYEVNGRLAHRMLIDGDWRVVDRSTGMLYLIQGKPIIGWHPTAPDFASPRAVTVPKWLSLPPLAERSLISATGLVPTYHEGCRVYRNVRREVAQKICNGLGVVLNVSPHPLLTTYQGAT